jgi:hypothetical protein
MGLGAPGFKQTLNDLPKKNDESRITIPQSYNLCAPELPLFGRLRHLEYSLVLGDQSRCINPGGLLTENSTSQLKSCQPS